MEWRPWQMRHNKAQRQSADCIRTHERNKGQIRAKGSQRPADRKCRQHRQLHRSAPAPWSEGKRQVCEPGERVAEYTVGCRKMLMKLQLLTIPPADMVGGRMKRLHKKKSMPLVRNLQKNGLLDFKRSLPFIRIGITFTAIW